MLRFVLRRVVLMVPTFIGITLLTFTIAHLAPGDPLNIDPEAAVGTGSAKESIETFRRQQGLDLPLWEQYLRWFRRVATLDFGNSSHDHRPVLEKIGEALPRTLLLSVLAL